MCAGREMPDRRRAGRRSRIVDDHLRLERKRQAAWLGGLTAYEGVRVERVQLDSRRQDTHLSDEAELPLIGARSVRRGRWWL
jgi:hypothetical protein